MNASNTKLLNDLEGAMRLCGAKIGGRKGRRRANALFALAEKRGLLGLISVGKIQGWPVITEYLKRESAAKEKRDAAALKKTKDAWGPYAHLGVDEQVIAPEVPKVDENSPAV